MCIGNEKINLCMNMKAVSMVCQLSGLRFLSKASEGRSINTEPAQPQPRSQLSAVPCLAQSSEAGRGLHFTNSEENHSVGLRTPPSEDALKHGIGLVTSETEYTLCDQREKTCVLGERAKPQGRLDKSILYFIHVFFCTDFDKCQMLKNDSCQVMLLKLLKTFYIKRHHLLEFKDCK